MARASERPWWFNLAITAAIVVPIGAIIALAVLFGAIDLPTESGGPQSKGFSYGPGPRLPNRELLWDGDWETQPPPGTLLLTMLTRDEETNLRRTLPKWASVADYWVIGVDEKTTDRSLEVIEAEMGHLPGHVVITRNFDGMGPAWTELVEAGLERYPEATHGIIADADFAPMGSFDKSQLDVRCSKHMFTIWTEDHSHERKMDWIYRNIPGARVERRTHQTLQVPVFEGQRVVQTLIDLHVEERRGGYQDRSGKKNERYIEFLEKDLADFPDDPRTLYYLGFAHFDIFNANAGAPTEAHWAHLARGVDYYTRRAAIPVPTGNAEERWFAVLKLAEIHERFYHEWDKALALYTECIEDDPARADPYFYIGQHYRLRGDHTAALPYLRTAATLPFPQRSLFQWLDLYDCFAPIEFAKAVAGAAPAVEPSDYDLALAQLRSATSSPCGQANAAEIEQVTANLAVERSKASPAARKALMQKALRKLGAFLSKGGNAAALRACLGAAAAEQVATHVAAFKAFLRDDTDWSCRAYRTTTTPFLRTLRLASGDDSSTVACEGGSDLNTGRLADLVERARRICRP